MEGGGGGKKNWVFYFGKNQYQVQSRGDLQGRISLVRKYFFEGKSVVNRRKNEKIRDADR